MPIPKNRSAEPLTRSEFETALRAWYENEADEERIGGSVGYSGTPWLWIRHGAERFHLNADTTRGGVEEYLALTRTHPQPSWTVVEGRAGRRTKVLFGPEQRAIRGFYLYARESGRTHRAAEVPRRGVTPPSLPAPLERYGEELAQQISAVFGRHNDLNDHRPDFPWLQGWLGDPFAGVWFVGENPSLAMLERQHERHERHGSHATPEAQWAASRGDQLLRQMLVEHGFKDGTPDSVGGWRCYLTNVVKEADYTAHWRQKTKAWLLEAAEIWAPVLRWELEVARPHLLVAMGKQPLEMLRHLERTGRTELPRIIGITHYAYIGQRADGRRGPMHPERIAEYDREFAEVARIAGAAREVSTRTGATSPAAEGTQTSVQGTRGRTATVPLGTPAARPLPAAAGLAALLVGQRLAERYRVEALIGRGGMGAVYRAVDERLGRAVALKAIALESTDPAAVERLRGRFRREARAAARLRHPNVVAVHDYGTEERLGLDYLVMELLEGEDLAARLARTTALPPPLAVRILTEASHGVAAGHRAGLVHRDVKPANLFLEQGGDGALERVRVLDFGIAQIMGAGDDTLTHLTVFGSGPFSPAYASPEQLRGARELTLAADVFALAVTGFQMLTGTKPFTPEGVQRLAAGREVPVPSARERGARIPASLDRVLQTGMALAPEDRYADADTLASALRERTQGSPSGD